MKGIIWNCKEVKWKYVDKEPLSAAECLLVYVCCENGDTNKETKEVIRRISQLNRKRYKKEAIVLFPFAHLSDNILDSKQAKDLIKKLATSLEKTMNVSIMGFDTNKEVNIHLLPNNGDVSYFSY